MHKEVHSTCYLYSFICDRKVPGCSSSWRPITLSLQTDSLSALTPTTRACVSIRGLFCLVITQTVINSCCVPLQMAMV